ncbi:MAG TPA: hypothetical protein VGA67_01415, partial [Candidatus Dojkabacteria bacterium]
MPIEAPNIPESFKVFMAELRALGINVDLIEADQDDIDPNDVVEGVVATEEELKKERSLTAETKEDKKEEVVKVEESKESEEESE